jgi:hypothetical protein
VIGRLDELDILRSLEPKYSENRDLKKLSGFGLSADFLRTTLNQFDLWKAPLDDICRKSMKLNVAGLIESPIEGEFIDADASINQAVHQMIMGHHHTLLVTKAQTVVGVLRIDDVFHEICARMRACKL